MHETMAEKIKYRLSQRLDGEAEEAAREVIDDFFEDEERAEKKKDALRNVKEELTDKQEHEPSEISRVVEENIWDLF